MAQTERRASPPRTYPDLHDHLDALERDGFLIRVRRPINKDTELHPLVRWQFRGGIPERERKAFLFEHVVDSSGREYGMPVVVGSLAASRWIYARGLGCDVDQVNQKWLDARANPIAPIEVESGPVHDVVRTGAQLDEPGGGLDGLPVPISTPGWDNAPYITAGHYLTRDPETGIYNLGNYRGHLKGRRRVGMNASHEFQQGIIPHIEKARARGEPLPCAIILGGPPAVSYTSVQKLRYDEDELTVAGGLVGAPIQLVRCKTVDLMVPADADVVIEGLIDSRWLEPEGPFGESHGHVNLQEYNNVMEVTAITHRRDAILPSIISQVTPSESSMIKKVALEPMFTDHLRQTLGIRSVVRVALHEPLTNLRRLVVVQMSNPSEQEVWQALFGATSYQLAVGKFVVAVDEDIDPENTDAVMWAICYRSRPHKDLQVIHGKDPGHSPRVGDRKGDDGEDSAMLINATLRTTFPPISLPKREYMERAAQIWDELDLPALKPESPWYGYSLGQWSDEFEEEARLAVEGRWEETGQKLHERRRDDVEPNSSVWEH
ncbi:MAG: 3-octaprenyl-4-hydroxybenzoate carboxy-lyase [Chloroflexi bacterium]|nr:3-octaprenyl-4-hydroxybenzoate carboxy-lyase [Chloroflexota bacterium]